MPTPAKAFAEQYRSFIEDELLQLALDRRDLLPAASAALEAELAARGLGDEAIQNFRDRLRTPAEDEHDSLQQGPPPPPTDLPENRFDEKFDDSTLSLAPFRPKGVTICAFIFWLSAVVGALESALMIINDTASSIVGIALSGLIFVAGCGLWRLRPWARKLGVGLCWTIAALVTVTIVDAAVMKLRGAAIDPLWVLSWVWMVIWNVLWALYLSSETTRKAFVPENQSTMNADQTP